MAEEKAPDLFGLGATNAGLADAIMRQAKALEVDFETFKGYKKVVDELLTKLGDSPADDKKLAHGTLPKGALGKNFAEADALHTTYTTVHEQLQNLSKGLATQIEALGIAILTSGKGYAGVDEETRARMRSLVRQAEKDYVPDRDPMAQQKKKDAEHGSTGETNKPKGHI